MISWFDITFFLIVMGFELHWFLKGRQDDRDFESFKKTIEDQLLEVNQRLELSIEKVDNPRHLDNLIPNGEPNWDAILEQEAKWKNK